MKEEKKINNWKENKIESNIRKKNILNKTFRMNHMGNAEHI